MGPMDRGQTGLVLAALAVAGLLLLAGDMLSQQEAGPDGAVSPPEIVLEVDGETVRGGEGSYCWGPDGSGQALCVDKIAPQDLVHALNMSPVAVPGDATFRFRTEGHREPANYSYSIQRNATGDWATVASGQTAGTFRPGLAPGTYILATFADWDRGDASWVFWLTAE